MFAAISLGISLLSSLSAARSARAARDLDAQALEENRAQARLENAMRRRAEVRKGQKATAEARNNAAGSGATMSTALTGSVNTARANTAQRVSFLDTMRASEDRQFTFQRRANVQRGRAADAESIASVANTGYEIAGGRDSLGSLFS